MLYCGKVSNSFLPRVTMDHKLYCIGILGIWIVCRYVICILWKVCSTVGRLHSIWKCRVPSPSRAPSPPYIVSVACCMLHARGLSFIVKSIPSMFIQCCCCTYYVHITNVKTFVRILRSTIIYEEPKIWYLYL